MTQPTFEYLKECFIYDPLTGSLTWRDRPREHFNTLNAFGTFSTRFSGKVAGHIDLNGYLVIGILGKVYKAHRIIWCLKTGAWPSDQIDHRDHDRANNMWDNLREANSQQNATNQSLHSNNTSGVSGVHWHKKTQKWMVRINTKGKVRIYGGIFDDFLEAVSVRKSLELKHDYHENHGQTGE